MLGTPVRRRGRLLHAFHGCVRRIIALAVHIRARGSHGRASLFSFPPRVGFCAARKQRRRRRHRRGKDRKTEGSRESKSSGYIAALDRLSFSLSLFFFLARTLLFSSTKNARTSPIDRFANTELLRFGRCDPLSSIVFSTSVVQ